MPSSLKRSAEEAGLDAADLEEHISRPPNLFLIFLSCARYAHTGEPPKGSQVWNAMTFLGQNPHLLEWFQLVQTPERVEENLPIQEYNKRIAKIWRRLSEKQKQPFEEEAKRCKERHTELYPDYVYRPKKKVKASVSAVGKPKRKPIASSSPASTLATPSTASTSSSSPSFSPGGVLATPGTVSYQLCDLPVVPSAFDYGNGSTTCHPFVAHSTPYSSFAYGAGTTDAAPPKPEIPSVESYGPYYDPRLFYYATQQYPVDATIDCLGSSSVAAWPLPPTNFVGEEGSWALLGNSQYDYSPQGLAPLLDFNGIETFQDGLTSDFGANLLGLDLGLTCEGSPDPMAGSLFDDTTSVAADFGSSFSAVADTGAWDTCWSRSPGMHAASLLPTGC